MSMEMPMNMPSSGDHHGEGLSGGGGGSMHGAMSMVFHQTTNVTLLFGWWSASGFGCEENRLGLETQAFHRLTVRNASFVND